MPALVSTALPAAPASTRRCCTTTFPASRGSTHPARNTFGALAARLEAIAGTDRPPGEKLDAAVSAMAAFIDAHAFFPSIMLREVAEGGTHLDAEALAALASVPRAFAAILLPGIDAGVFRPMNPLSAYFTTVAPILMFVSSTPVRKQLRRAASWRRPTRP
jgi:endonuclease V-like protein UPF0215 family